MIEAVAWLTLGIALWLTVALWRHSRQLVRRYEAPTELYPLFRVRHKVVMLVATGEMKESDPEWQMLYRAVNGLVSQGEHLTRYFVCKFLFKNFETILADDALKAAVDDLEKIYQKKKEENAVFRQVTEEFDEALKQVLTERSNLFQVVAPLVLAVVFLLRIVFLAWNKHRSIRLRSRTRRILSIRPDLPSLSQLDGAPVLG